MIPARQRAVLFAVAIFFLIGCGSRDDTPGPQAREVVVYTSVDQHYAEPVLKEFERRTGIVVKAIYDVEAAKTTGLVNRLIAEKENPQADVFWNSEFVQTVRLQNQGMLAPFVLADSVLPTGAFLGPGGQWVAFGGRARVILADRTAIEARYGVTDSAPLSVLLDEQFPAARVGMAMPLFGTSATQAATLWARDGAERGTKFYSRIKERGVRIVDGNSVVRDLVFDGQLTIGLTDSDDADGAISRAGNRLISLPVYPPLVIPNTVAVISGSPRSGPGRQLANYLLEPAVRIRLERAGFLSSQADTLLAAIPTELLSATATAFPVSQAVLREIFVR